MEKIKILFASGEAVPFVKTGGLADVVGTLPKHFDSKKYDIRVVLPKYACIKNAETLKYITDFTVPLSWRNQYCGVFYAKADGITYYFIDNEFYYNASYPYSDMPWDMERFAFFSKAALSILPAIDFRPDIIHCHDWQAALIPVYLSGEFQANPFYYGIKTVMTVHNLKFQGIWGRDAVEDILGLSQEYFTGDKLEAYGGVNLLKGGLVYADRITTVSKTYAEEIKTPYYGEGLDGLMRAKSHLMCGIVNGIDYTEFNPSTDYYITKKYDADTLERKKADKAALQEELGLPVNGNVFLIGIVSRLTEQKGLELIECVIEELLNDNVQLAVLGTGEKRYEDMFKSLAERYPQKVSASIKYSDELSHRIYAGCDGFLMPSKFEPCGLSQLIALRYGTLPIVRETGGLKDTVEPFNEYEGTGTGFGFTNFNAHDMLSAIRYAEKIFFDKPEEWHNMAIRAMKADFSWNASAREYEKLYISLLKR